MNPGDKLINTRFGRLVVIGEYLPGRKAIKATKTSNHSFTRVYPSVLCKCDCGVTKRIYVDNLRSGMTISCGCFREENSSKMGIKFGKDGGLKRRKYSTVESSARDLFQKYIKRNPGNLEFKKFYELTQQNCHHCGSAPNQKYLVKNVTDDLGVYIYNGLDRINNLKGYDVDNIVPCCGICNFMRHTQSLDGFYNQIIKIAQNRNLKINS